MLPIRAHAAAIDASEQAAHFADKTCCRPPAGPYLRPRAIESHTTRAQPRIAQQANHHTRKLPDFRDSKM